MLLKQVPEILYKYRSFNDRTISRLENNQLYFANPLKFNDPFDCLAHEHIFDEIREDSIEELARLYSDVPPDAITRDKTNQLINALKQHPEIAQIKAEQEKLFKEFSKNLGVLSLSECNNSILMWSHYADYHKGFCIGFKNNIGFPEVDILRVKYSPSRTNDLAYQIISMSGMTFQERYQKLVEEIILTKYIDWHYEKEWRIVGVHGVKHYSDKYIDRIIFGIQMAEKERNILRQVFKNKSVRFFEAVKSKRLFAIEIQEIDNN